MDLIVMNACIEETAAQKRSPKFKTREAITGQDLKIFMKDKDFIQRSLFSEENMKRG